MLSTDDADERHEDLTGMDRIDRIRKSSFIPQAREHEVNEAKPGSAGRLTGFIDFTVPATNASPLDHARRAAGGELGETMFCLKSRACGIDSLRFPLATLLRNFFDG